MIIDKPLPRGARSQKPDKIIVHAMAEYLNYQGEVLHAPDFLQEIGLSAHILVCPNGDIIKCREDNQGAYHAKKFNVNSLGVEFLVTGEHDITSFEDMISEPYLTSIQYENGMKYIRDQWHLKLGVMRMDRHSDVSPERKVDPGKGFPWDRFCREVGICG